MLPEFQETYLPGHFAVLLYFAPEGLTHYVGAFVVISWHPILSSANLLIAAVEAEMKAPRQQGD